MLHLCLVLLNFHEQWHFKLWTWLDIPWSFGKKKPPTFIKRALSPNRPPGHHIGPKVFKTSCSARMYCWKFSCIYGMLQFGHKYHLWILVCILNRFGTACIVYLIYRLNKITCKRRFLTSVCLLSRKRRNTYKSVFKRGIHRYIIVIKLDDYVGRHWRIFNQRFYTQCSGKYVKVIAFSTLNISNTLHDFYINWDKI